MQGTKVHISIKTANMAASLRFYRDLFGVEPLKNYTDYAKFDLATPGLNLTLNEVETQPTEQVIDHLGIEFASREEVAAMQARVQKLGLEYQTEKETSCCYGIQDKLWVTDPNGIRWEFYTILVSDTGVSGCSVESTKPEAAMAGAS